MRKTNLLCYILLVIGMVAFVACQSNESVKHVSATPGEPIHDVTTTRLEQGAQDVKSGMNAGYGWVNGNGIFTTKPVADTAGDPGDTVTPEVYAGGSSRSDGYVLKDTIPCGQDFIDVQFTAAGAPTETDLTSADSIGKRTVAIYTGTDGQQLNLEDMFKYLFVESTLPTPHFEPSSTIPAKADEAVRYDYETGDENLRIVWIKVNVTQKVKGTSAGDPLEQTYEIGYYQKKDAAVTPPEPETDPLKIKMNILEMFRTYRANTKHSMLDLWMSFDVINAKTGVVVDNIDTDSRMAVKIGHFGSPSQGYPTEEERVLSAPTKVDEVPDLNNEEAEKATKTIGKFNFKVDAFKQTYYANFPVPGRPDEEGGIPAGGERLVFQLNGTYVDPEMNYTFKFEITHRTEVVIKGWEKRTPGYQKPTSSGISYEYMSSYVVEFIDHFYLNGEEIVWVDSDEGVFYYLVPSSNGQQIEVNNPDYNLYYTGSDYHPFHRHEMVVDGWKPIVE